jgi:hypothetical protein
MAKYEVARALVLDDIYDRWVENSYFELKRPQYVAVRILDTWDVRSNAPIGEPVDLNHRRR